MGLECCFNVVWCVLGGLGWFGVFWGGLGCFHGPGFVARNHVNFRCQDGASGIVVVCWNGSFGFLPLRSFEHVH